MKSGTTANNFSLMLVAEELQGRSSTIRIAGRVRTFFAQQPFLEVQSYDQGRPAAANSSQLARDQRLGSSPSNVANFLPGRRRLRNPTTLFQLSLEVGRRKSRDNEVQTVFAELASVSEPVRSAKDVGSLDLLPLKLTPGMSFRFSIAAEDSRPRSTGNRPFPGVFAARGIRRGTACRSVASGKSSNVKHLNRLTKYKWNWPRRYKPCP